MLNPNRRRLADTSVRDFQSTFDHQDLLWYIMPGAVAPTISLPASKSGIQHAEAGKGKSVAVCLPCTPCPAPQTAPMRLEIPLGSSCHPSLAPWQRQLLGRAQFLHVQPSTAVRAQLLSAQSLLGIAPHTSNCSSCTWTRRQPVFNSIVPGNMLTD